MTGLEVKKKTEPGFNGCGGQEYMARKNGEGKM